MKTIIQPPFASAILDSMRSIGYSFETALADIIDNSIAADAKGVTIEFRKEPLYLAIVDDGHGMDEAALLQAMRHGGIGPGIVRAQSDLGRYGLGLKTASLSQCRKLTVVSLVSGGTICGAQWDLDEIAARNEWALDVLDATELKGIAAVDDLARRQHGTIVQWSTFDRLAVGDEDAADAVSHKLAEAEDHLSLTFHRYLAPDKGEKGLKISVNGRALSAIDPFLKGHGSTEVAGDETYLLEGVPIAVSAYILPHISKLSPAQLDQATGGNNLRDSQGFYIYRNRRLITYGTWFRLLGRDELTRLARIQIDLPNSLDHAWQLDVKKSAAYPPEAVRSFLRRIIKTVSDKSKNVFRERRASPQAKPTDFLWTRIVTREGVRYEINREHFLVADFINAVDEASQRKLKALLLAIDESLPTRQIYIDQATDQTVSQRANVEAADFRQLIHGLIDGLTPSEQFRVVSDLKQMDPFRLYPDEVNSLLSELKNAK